MTFSSIMTFLCIAYVLGYGGMVVYDLFFSKEGVEIAPVMEEEEIDISDEAMAFSPIIIEKEDNAPQEEEPVPDDVVAMTGGIEINDLVPKLEDLSVNGKNSELGAVVNDWNENYAAA
jgi:hypothetical protein